MKTGWIIEIVNGLHKLRIDGRSFYSGTEQYATRFLAQAYVLPIRRRARGMVWSTNEVVRKVEVDESGRAVKIIPGR